MSPDEQAALTPARAIHSLPSAPPMPSTHLSLHFHVVFSTKDRMPQISPEWRAHFHSYIGGVAKNSGVVPEAIGGVAYHVHLLLGLPATMALSDVIRTIKANSSKWVHEEVGMEKFAWQEGYGAFTVGPGNREAVASYIDVRKSITAPAGFRRSISGSSRKPARGMTNAFSGELRAVPAGTQYPGAPFRWLTPPANLFRPCRGCRW
jgi:putative transposase